MFSQSSKTAKNEEITFTYMLFCIWLYLYYWQGDDGVDGSIGLKGFQGDVGELVRENDKHIYRFFFIYTMKWHN